MTQVARSSTRVSQNVAGEIYLLFSLIPPPHSLSFLCVLV